MNRIRTLCFIWASALFPAALLFSLAGEEVASPEPFSDLMQFVEASEEDPTQLADIIDQQRELGADVGLLLHARVLSILWTGNFSEALEVADALNQRVESGAPIAPNGLFSRENERASMINMLRARVALEQGEAKSFEKYVKEAYWLDPMMGDFMAPWIESHRQSLAIGSLIFPLDHEITTSGGETVTLAGLMEDSEAVLLDFWATWCGPCVALMPELLVKEEKLKPQGILVAGMNTENRGKAEQFRKENEIDITWLVEPEGRPFSNLLEVDSIPRMVLVDKQGNIHFNGHPMDPALNEALAALGATL